MIEEITAQDLNVEQFIDDKTKEIDSTVGDGTAINALSGGVDSSTVTMLGHRALGDRLKTIFIENGIMRQGEPEQVVGYFRDLGVTVDVVDARDVANAHIIAAEKGEIGERYIVGGHNYAVKDALCIAANVAGVREPRFEIPLWAINGIVRLGELLPFLPVPANHLRTVAYWQGYNCDKAKNMLDLSPRPFRETVGDALAWFRETGHL